MPSLSFVMSWSALAIATLAGALASTSGTSSLPPTTFAATEVARLRAHFDSLDTELRARDVRSLSPAQRAARARHVERLRGYRDRGVFPRNDDFPGRRVAYFVDEQGTRCAMAHLIEASGRADLVERVRSTRNHALIPELASDPALVAWLDSAGLTAAEAARIQPAYEYDEYVDYRNGNSVSATYATASIVSGALGAASVALNLSAPARSSTRGRRAVLGFVAGAVSLGLAAVHADDIRTSRYTAVANAVVGTASVGAATWTLVRRRDEPRAASVGRRGERGITRLALAPHALRGGGGGLRVSARF
jgi:hypothetical protein